MSFDKKKYLKKKDKKKQNKKTAACIKAKLGFFNGYFWSEIAYTFRFDGSMDTFYRLTNLCKYHFFFHKICKYIYFLIKKKIVTCIFSTIKCTSKFFYNVRISLKYFTV